MLLDIIEIQAANMAGGFSAYTPCRRLYFISFGVFHGFGCIWTLF